MRRLWALFIVVLPIVAMAAVYKYRDERGRVIFSDTARPGAERVEMPPLQTYEPQDKVGGGAPNKLTTNDDGPNAQYTELSVTSPGPGEAVRDNAGNVQVSVSIEPALKPGDGIVLFMDGQRVGGPGNATTFALKEVSRGEHNLEVQVVNPANVVLKSTTSVFYLLRKSALLPRTQSLLEPQSPSFLTELLSIFS